MAAICLAYGLAMVSLLPWAPVLLRPMPAMASIYATAVFVCDACTCTLLLGQFLALRQAWLAVLASAFLYSGLMALAHLATYPGAVIPDAAIVGQPASVAWLYLAWNLGFLLLLLAALVVHSVRRHPVPGPAAGPYALRCTAGVALGMLLLVLLATSGLHLLPQLMAGNRFSPLNVALGAGRTVLAVAGLVLLWTTSRQRSSMAHLWLSLTLVAGGLAQVMTDLGGQRYTFGWYAGRMSFIVASSVLLLVLLAEFARTQRALAATVDDLQAQARRLRVEIDRRELAERKLRLSQKMEAIGRMAGGVAHDFNNLLAAVVANLEIILLLTRDQPKVHEHAGHAREVALRGGRLTRSLLGFAQRQPLRAQDVQPQHLLEQFRVLMQRAVGTVGIDLDTARSRWLVRVDPEQFEIALLNLVVNARDAMPGGGAVRIRVEDLRWPPPVATAPDLSLPSGEYVAFSVTDTGSGMAPGVMERLFEPFFTTKAVGQGSGLGLSQVRGFVLQSGGDVAVESAVGAGTTVTLYLPRGVGGEQRDS